MQSRKTILGFVVVISLVTLGACGGGSNGAPANEAPDITNGIADQTVDANTAIPSVDLSTVFADDTTDPLSFSVTGNSNPTLLSSSIAGSQLTLTLGSNQTGTATVTVRATDTEGEFIENTFTLTVNGPTLEITAVATGAEEEPPVASAGSAAISLSLNELTNELTGSVVVTGITPTDSHLHTAFAGANGGVTIGLVAHQTIAGRFDVPDGTILDAGQLASFLGGETYINVHTAANPAGELRAQILTGGIEVLRTTLAGMKEVPAVASAASGRAALTLIPSTSADFVLNVNTDGVDDATAAHIHQAFAGTTGGVLVGLIQDAGDPGVWGATGTFDDIQEADLLAGQLYVNVHTAANPGGEIRGQLAGPNVQVTFANLTGDQEAPPVVTAATAVGAATVNLVTGDVTAHVNGSVELIGAVAAHIHVGELGISGPVVVGLTQDGGDPLHWLVEDATLAAADLAAYSEGRLYFNVHTPANPGGEVRGQIVPEGVTPPTFQFQVTASDPSNGASLETAPDIVTVTFNADIDGSTLTNNVTVEGSGGDGIFGNGNDVAVAPDSVAVNGTDADQLDIDLPAGLADDTYRVTLTGTGGAPLMDVNGNTLDGDSDDVAGGDHVFTFDVAGINTATLSFIQENVFTPSCAFAGCHAPPVSENLNLTDGAAFVNLVDAAASGKADETRVIPNDADGSYLIRKLEGGPDINGGQMPASGCCLAQPVIDNIRAWIDAGADDN